MPLFRSFFLIGLFFLALSSPVNAQRIEDTRSSAPRVNLVSTNPIGLIFEWYNGEFEHAVRPTASLAVAASHFNFDEFIYTSVDGIVRYYPGARALRGFSFGGTVGYVHFSDDSDDCPGCVDTSGDAFTIGVRGDYVWILGRDQRFTVAAGLGAKRLFDTNDSVDEPDALPIARLSIGYAW
jgi:hypothetical protein